MNLLKVLKRLSILLFVLFYSLRAEFIIELRSDYIRIFKFIKSAVLILINICMIQRFLINCLTINLLKINKLKKLNYQLVP